MAATLTEVTVTVTQEHIDAGERESCSSCPVALAFAAAIPEAIDSAVTWRYASVWFGSRGVVNYKLPPSATGFIGAFDSEEPVAPFTFTAVQL
jgi:hypothetical protein